MMESYSSPGDLGRGLITVEKSESLHLNRTSEDQHKSETEPVAKSLQSMSSLSVNAEPFKSSSLNHSEKSQLSASAKEFVPQKPTTNYYMQPEATVRYFLLTYFVFNYNELISFCFISLTNIMNSTWRLKRLILYWNMPSKSCLKLLSILVTFRTFVINLFPL